MRIDAVSENPLETILSATGLLPLPVVRLVWSSGYVRAFCAALELELFDALHAFGKEGANAEQLAQKLGADSSGVHMLLKALNGFGMLRRKAERFFLTKESQRWLVSSSSASQRDALEFGPLLDELLKELPASIRAGRRTNFHERLTKENWRRYERGLAAFAKLTAPEVARKVPVDGEPKRLLDVAGGHGQYSVAMTRKYPDLFCEVLDLPQGVEQGRELVSEAKMAERVSFREGDLKHTVWGEGYDVVFLFNILHNLPEAAAREAVQRAFAALRGGGTVAILDAQNAGGDGDLSFASGYGALLFYLLSESETWPEPVIRGWLAEAGFSGARKRRLLSMPDTLLLCARKP